MTSLQQQKDYIDSEAQKAKERADQDAKDQRQVAADAEIARVRKVAEDEVKQIQYDAQK
jgi:type I restriction-modification system DNA methylase subunit